jgi:hypothetical protein
MASATAPRQRLEFFTETCSRVLAGLKHGPVFGLDLGALCGRADRVRFIELDSDDKVRLCGDSVHVHDAYALALAHEPSDLGLAAMRIALYFVHELAHLPQGIGQYSTVRTLRAIDECELLHLDLAADHVAALSLRRVEPYALAELKRAQAESLNGFPIDSTHTPGARLRKARRSVSLCADALLSQVQPNDGRYVVASFAPDAARFALVAHGQGAPRTLFTCAVSREENERLCKAADRLDAGGADARATTNLLRSLIAPSESGGLAVG